MSFDVIQKVLEALKSHRQGATIRDVQRWINDRYPDPIPYGTVRYNLVGLHRIGLIACRVEGRSSRKCNYAVRRWFAKKIVDDNS